MTTEEALREELRALLTRARLDRDRAVAAAVRSTLAALDNAEAVPERSGPEARPAGGSAHVAGAAAGLGAAEVERRTLDPAEERAVVAAEVTDLRAAADQYDAAGHRAEALDARRAADVLGALSGVTPAG